MLTYELIEDTRPEEAPPMTWVELHDRDFEKSIAIFLDCIDGNYFEVFRAVREDCRCAGIVERMENRANQETR